MKKHPFSQKRIPYAGKRIKEKTNPFHHFGLWFKEALKKAPDEPHAMALATATKSGKPSVRMMLLKSFSKEGFLFYTNYSSRKGSELLRNPYASICFFWPTLHHQVRIEGKIQKVSLRDAGSYFKTRPRGSQLAASISKQSSPLPSYEDLVEQLHLVSQETRGKQIPRPKTWGGFCLVPTYFEFWSGKPDRLHERVTYTKRGNRWVTGRLYP